MNLINMFAVLATISEVTMASAGFPQAIKIFKKITSKLIKQK